MDERAFYTESFTTRPVELNCPHCRTTAVYELNWMLRRKKDRLPPHADDRDRARFARAQSYMVLQDDKVGCSNLKCRKRFDVSGIKTMAFLSKEQEAALGSVKEERDQRRPKQRSQGQQQGHGQRQGQGGHGKGHGHQKGRGPRQGQGGRGQRQGGQGSRQRQQRGEVDGNRDDRQPPGDQDWNRMDRQPYGDQTWNRGQRPRDQKQPRQQKQRQQKQQKKRRKGPIFPSDHDYLKNR